MLISLLSTVNFLGQKRGAHSFSSAYFRSFPCAALRSKAGISASIAQQEARNEQLRAQGEQQAIKMRMGEAERLQNADILGRQYMFDAQEQRDVADISRLSAMSQQFAQQEMDAAASGGNLLGTVISAVGGPIVSAAADKLFN